MMHRRCEVDRIGGFEPKIGSQDGSLIENHGREFQTLNQSDEASDLTFGSDILQSKRLNHAFHSNKITYAPFSIVSAQDFQCGFVAIAYFVNQI